MTGRKRNAIGWAFLPCSSAALADLPNRISGPWRRVPLPATTRSIKLRISCTAPFARILRWTCAPPKHAASGATSFASSFREGWSEARIKQYFVDQYGARVLAEPPPAGLNWLVYVLPPVIILAGAFLLFRALRTWTQPAARPAAWMPREQRPTSRRTSTWPASRKN